MQIKAVVLYHRDGERHHELVFNEGRLNVVTGVSDTGKSAVVEIIDYCLGSGGHGVYKGIELESIGWYGLRLTIDGQDVFVARRRPPQGQQTSDHAMFALGLSEAPAPDEIVQTTNVATTTTELGRMIGIAENLQQPPEGSRRQPVAAGLRHAMPYVLQPQRLIADPKYLFDGQENNFKEQHIRDTLPYFLGAVDRDALAQRRELRQRRLELRAAQAALADAVNTESVITTRAQYLLEDAQKNGLIEAGRADADGAILLADHGVLADDVDVRAILRAAIDASPTVIAVSLTGEAGQIAELQDRKSELGDAIRELRAERRALSHRLRLAADFVSETGEQRARLLSLDLLSGTDVDPASCPLCGSIEHHVTPTAAQLRRELESVQAQTAASKAAEPQLQSLIELLDARIQESAGRLNEIDRELKALVERSEAARRARGRLEQQAYLRGRIAGFLEEHPATDASTRDELSRAAELAAERVEHLEESLSADSTRRRTENALSYVGADMTAMAQRLHLGYSDDGVQLDPVALTVVARDRNGPVWLNEDIGSGKNWVGYHVVTLLALHRYYVEHLRPVPRLLVLDQPTQAFFPTSKRHDSDRRIADLPDEDQEQVARIFDLLHSTVDELAGKMQIIVMDHAELDAPWFPGAVGDNTWRGGRGLVPADWYE
jgi:hypothetical protein